MNERPLNEHPFVRANGRYIFFILIVLGIFGYLAAGLMDLQLFGSDVMSTSAVDKRTAEIYLRGSRGMITDADSIILADDEDLYNVTFYRDGSQNAEKDYVAFTNAITQTIAIIEKNGGKLSVASKIERDPETGMLRFNFGSGVSDAVLAERERQWRANHYLSVTAYPTAEDCFNRLKKLYQIPDGTDEALIFKIMAVYSEMQMNLFNSQPIIIAKNVAYETVMEVETRSMMLPGMEISVGTKRVYPKSTLASQVIGYTGFIQSQSQYQDLKAKGYALNDTIGLDGIEGYMEDWLTQNSSQRQGVRVVERDRLGKVTRVISNTEPQDGNNVKLTIKASFQQQAERAIADNIKNTRDIQERKMVLASWLEANKDAINNGDRDWVKAPPKLAEHGVLMVIDMQGRVLAMANSPTYDLNAMVAGGKEAAQIQSDPRKILQNFAISTRGAPGSIFKMVTGLAALMEGQYIEGQTTISDEGPFIKYEKNTLKAPKCWIQPNQRWQHKNQTLIQGLQHSCNYFFFELGSRLFENGGGNSLYKYASMLGLTSLTGIDLPGEKRSVVGNQNSLYDPNRAMGEANQDTSKPILVFNSLKKHFKNFGASRNIEYDDERLNRCCKRLMDMAVNTDQGPEGETWIANMRVILMDELSMTREMVWLQAVIGDAYNYLNEIKWGGSYAIQTAIGQGITVLSPVAVARYVAAVANGGNVYNLMLVDSIISPEGEVVSQRVPTLLNTIPGAEDLGYLKLLREGMKGVVDDETGTASKYFKGFQYKDMIAAKTGTAENSPIDLENNSWFVAFAPYDNPQIAVVSFIPNGYSGAEASMAVKEFIQWYMDKQTLTTEESELPGGNQLSP